MMYIVDPVYSGDIGSLRAKVSHTWIDHEIAMVDTTLAISRWRSGTWPRIASRWEFLHEGALEFGELFDGFSAAILVDALPPFKAMAHVNRDELKRRLGVLHGQLIDVPAFRQDYLAAVQKIWEAAQAFFVLVKEPSATESEVAASWSNVREAGAVLKVMFSSGRIPKGVVLP